MRRGLLSVACLVLPMLTAIPISAPAWQGEDLTFKANHNGLEQLDVLSRVRVDNERKHAYRGSRSDEGVRPTSLHFAAQASETEIEDYDVIAQA
jgi:hypothetical protein